jgi:hypothetical protein
VVVGAGSRVLGFTFGKAIAFTYAVIVSVVANVVFDLVRNSPHTGSTDPIAFAAPRRTADSPTAGALIPAPPETVANIAPVEPVPATAAPPADKPGPGSGGLY